MDHMILNNIHKHYHHSICLPKNWHLKQPTSTKIYCLRIPLMMPCLILSNIIITLLLFIVDLPFKDQPSLIVCPSPGPTAHPLNMTT